MNPKPSVLRAIRTPEPLATTKVWLEARSARERVLLLGLGVLVCVTCVWYGAVSPLVDIRDAAHARLNAAQQIQAGLEAGVASTGAEKLTALPGPLSDVMATRAAAFGLLLTPLEIDGSDSSAQGLVVNGRYDAVMAFVATLERVDGARVQNLTLVSEGKPGLVRLQVSAVRP